jgi:hypothetical protein
MLNYDGEQPDIRRIEKDVVRQFGGSSDNPIEESGWTCDVIIVEDADPPYIIKVPRAKAPFDLPAPDESYSFFRIQIEASALRLVEETRESSPLKIPRVLKVARSPKPHLVTSYIDGDTIAIEEAKMTANIVTAIGREAAKQTLWYAKNANPTTFYNNLPKTTTESYAWYVIQPNLDEYLGPALSFADDNHPSLSYLAAETLSLYKKYYPEGISAHSQPKHMIHGDLHLGNIKFTPRANGHMDRLPRGVIDFGQARLGEICEDIRHLYDLGEIAMASANTVLDAADLAPIPNKLFEMWRISSYVLELTDALKAGRKDTPFWEHKMAWLVEHYKNDYWQELAAKEQTKS